MFSLKEIIAASDDTMDTLAKPGMPAEAARNGVGSLRAYVVALTEVPYDVILTHGHVDHASDATEFADKRVYLHPADRHLMSCHTDSSRRSYSRYINR